MSNKRVIVPIPAQVGLGSEFFLRTPPGGVIRHFGIQDKLPTIWIEGIDDPTRETESRRFTIIQDCDEVPQRATYVATHVLPHTALHLYELPLITLDS